MKNNENKKPHDMTWALSAILLLMVTAAILGIVSSSKTISLNNRTEMIDEYNDNMVIFSVLGYGEYQSSPAKYSINMNVPEDIADEEQNMLISKGYTVYRLPERPAYDTSKVILQAKVLDAHDLDWYLQEKGYENKTEKLGYNKAKAVATAYDRAYNEAVEKGSSIAMNTGKAWRIIRVDEISTVYDEETGITESIVKISFAVDGNISVEEETAKKAK